jgi:hypothetical protein
MEIRILVCQTAFRRLDSVLPVRAVIARLVTNAPLDVAVSEMQAQFHSHKH